jgi:hypothetical protein
LAKKLQQKNYRKAQKGEQSMKTILITTICILLGIGSICNAGVIFDSKWDNPNSKAGNVVDDGGVWSYAYVDSGNITLERVTGDQSSLGGPSGPPPNSGATYYVSETWVPNGQDCQVYLQKNFSTSYTDLYMGMWFYWMKGMTFIDSMKFMDFRTNNPAVGNGHLVLFGFDHQAYYCANTKYGNPSDNTGSWWSSNGTDQNLTAWKYLSAAGKNVSSNEYCLNYYDVSPLFDSNLDIYGNVVGRSGYNPNNVNRIHITGGYWTAMIVHAKIDPTDGRIEAWIKKGSDPLYKVMQWDRNTAWSSDNSSPHDFYTVNGTKGIDHIQINAYWNNWPKASGTRKIWLSNVIVATTLDEVNSYLGITDTDVKVPGAPAGLRIVQ